MVKSIYYFILSRGVSKEWKLEDKLTSFLNVISALTSLASFGIFLATLLFSNDYLYMAVSLGVSIMYLLLVILNHFHLTRLAKLYLTSIIPLWYAITIICIGGYFSQSIATAATVGMAFIFFRDKRRLRNGLIIYNILLYLISTLYITINPPIFGVRDFPLDEIVVFMLCLGWISLVFYYYELDTKNYINTLKNKNSELNQKTIELERFAFIASHDIKSPLQNIIGYLNILDKKFTEGKTENLTVFINYAKQGAHQIDELIKGVLEITALGQTLETKNYSEINLNLSLDKALFNLKNEIAKTNTVIKRDTLPFYFCYEAHLILIFQNIIQNAVKYNKSIPPVISITSTIEDNNVIIEIKDNGIGIEKKYNEYIFEFFKRLHNSSEYVGTGLGLGLVKKIIGMYDGKVLIDSVVGEYSIFKIYLPQKNINTYLLPN